MVFNLNLNLVGIFNLFSLGCRLNEHTTYRRLTALDRHSELRNHLNLRKNCWIFEHDAIVTAPDDIGDIYLKIAENSNP